MLKKRTTILFFALLAVVILGFLVVLRLFPTTHSASINRYAGEYGLDAHLIAAMIKCESNYDNEAESGKGAIGLMQLLPSTAEWVAERCGAEYEETRLYDSEYNIRLGCAYFAYLKEQMGSEEMALAAYNAGPANVRAWENQGITEAEEIPFPETRKYVDKVQKTKKIYKILYAFKEI